MNEKTVIRIGIDMAKALRSAWQEHAMLHRELKPGNITLDRREIQTCVACLAMLPVPPDHLIE